MIAYKVLEREQNITLLSSSFMRMLVFWCCRLYMDDKYQQNDKSFVNTFIDLLIVGPNTATHS